eukprot:TRINITY_DN67620_c1_g12_i1.p1 TRINITY_DN67620_c1_g12~~TRINITY_DN67620_c1_g12_i1.p1  ORF type:complete len:510 (-),score=-5.73 TRINITY_DN67620_c1_g12_i1:205-1734(-)
MGVTHHNSTMDSIRWFQQEIECHRTMVAQLLNLFEKHLSEHSHAPIEPQTEAIDANTTTTGYEKIREEPPPSPLNWKGKLRSNGEYKWISYDPSEYIGSHSLNDCIRSSDYSTSVAKGLSAKHVQPELSSRSTSGLVCPKEIQCQNSDGKVVASSQLSATFSPCPNHGDAVPRADPHAHGYTSHREQLTPSLHCTVQTDAPQVCSYETAQAEPPPEDTGCKPTTQHVGNPLGQLHGSAPTSVCAPCHVLYCSAYRTEKHFSHAHADRNLCIATVSLAANTAKSQPVCSNLPKTPPKFVGQLGGCRNLRPVRDDSPKQPALVGQQTLGGSPCGEADLSPTMLNQHEVLSKSEPVPRTEPHEMAPGWICSVHIAGFFPSSECERPLQPQQVERLRELFELHGWDVSHGQCQFYVGCDRPCPVPSMGKITSCLVPHRGEGRLPVGWQVSIDFGWKCTSSCRKDDAHSIYYVAEVQPRSCWLTLHTVEVPSRWGRTWTRWVEPRDWGKFPRLQ